VRRRSQIVNQRDHYGGRFPPSSGRDRVVLRQLKIESRLETDDGFSADAFDSERDEIPWEFVEWTSLPHLSIRFSEGWIRLRWKPPSRTEFFRQNTPSETSSTSAIGTNDETLRRDLPGNQALPNCPLGAPGHRNPSGFLYFASPEMPSSF